MKRTDKEIIEAMTFIKDQHNGELPYVFGTLECANMMAKYLTKQLDMHIVGVSVPIKEETVIESLKRCKGDKIKNYLILPNGTFDEDFTQTVEDKTIS